MMDSYTVLTAPAIVPLPWARPPLSQNDRQHHHTKAKAMKRAIDEARLMIRDARPGHFLAAHVELHWQIPDRRQRDSDNLAVTTKAVIDALVAEGVLPEDWWAHVPHSGQTIHPPAPGVPAAMWVELTPPGGAMPAVVRGTSSGAVI